MQTELKLRIASGVVLAAVALAATWFGGLAFQFLSVLIALLVYYEWSTITGLVERDFQGNAFGWLSMAVIAALVVSGYIGYSLPFLAFGVGAAMLWVFVQKTSWWLPGGIAYAGLTGISLAALRGADDLGLIATLFVFAVVWATDIFAYFTGRAIGGPKLAPRISPGKTWSGAIGGTICGILAGVAVFMAYFSLQDLRIPIIALVLSVASQVGDLFESFIKRRFGVKDSSRLIPGHGGVMDRVDGLIFACVAALILVMIQYFVSDGRQIAFGSVLLGP
ncbi:phosphatidate cytidylyltransferase [Ensifer adhaerens]|jgi:phosphatidate cytidylyltransferase|uniref:phosphatidate cytidylyltransferase n=1 Tax=Ensifer TaxID=106591 RepID=UPI001A627862|nr:MULTISPECIES: phosphatidate cytidylyltransferase [Ensifer]MBK5567554.1 phosphatidate cytidylyltransferase [Ensifer sp. SSB1]MBZ7921413.1 phosphatidate cytidylyltransferase [Ensifer adhaerens]UAX93840.1 phosphatidate cytidylyltransferase [Ensifer adhaerens]UAY01476.1 phosphatidate cytidylyltransferase [Ensifer adhaerens]UAY08859.1 phosphatidate cytidylyltransferase [Ensifer adhaerens]